MDTPASFALLPQILKRIWLQLLLLCVLLSAHVWSEFLPQLKDHPSFMKIVSFLGVWIVAWGLTRILQVLKDAPSLSGHLSPDVRGIVFTLSKLALYALAFLVALDTIGVSITPLIASLGVGSIAVGLALQDTLGNLISGAYLYLDRPVAIGDWIRLDTGLEGQVTRIGWRTTRLVAADNMVVIPNSKLSSAILTNLNLPVAEIAVTLGVGVGYDSDLDRVEKVLTEIGAEFLRIFPGAVSGSHPVVRFQSFGDSSIHVNLTVKVKSYGDQITARHDLLKAIHARFIREKIEIPFPQRVVQTRSLSV